MNSDRQDQARYDLRTNPKSSSQDNCCCFIIHNEKKVNPQRCNLTENYYTISIFLVDYWILQCGNNRTQF